MKIPKKVQNRKKHKKIIKSKNTKNTSEITRGGNCENDDKNEDKESEDEESVDEDSEDQDGDDEDAECDGEEVEDRSKMKMKTNEDKRRVRVVRGSVDVGGLDKRMQVERFPQVG